MSYKHKVYIPCSFFDELYRDYPILKPYERGQYVDVEGLNKLIGEDVFHKSDMWDSNTVNKLLDILEDKGLIHNER